MTNTSFDEVRCITSPIGTIVEAHCTLEMDQHVDWLGPPPTCRCFLLLEKKYCLFHGKSCRQHLTTFIPIAYRPYIIFHSKTELMTLNAIFTPPSLPHSQTTPLILIWKGPPSKTNLLLPLLTVLQTYQASDFFPVVCVYGGPTQTYFCASSSVA